jgi:hypothetical protein
MRFWICWATFSGVGRPGRRSKYSAPSRRDRSQAALGTSAATIQVGWKTTKNTPTPYFGEIRTLLKKLLKGSSILL